MIRKMALGTLAVAAVGGMLFGRDAGSYMKTGFRSVRESVKREVPIAFELERARNEVAQLLPEIRKSVHVVAEEQVEVEQLRESLAKKEARLSEQEEAILALSSDLKSGDAKFVYMGRKYSVSEVERDLAERFNRFTILEETVKREREMLVARERALNSHRETLEQMLSQRKNLEVELERLEARVRTVESRKQLSTLDLDDSQLARAKSLIKEIDKRLDIEDRILDTEGSYGGFIPVEADEEVDPQDILEKIESRFGGQKSDDANAAPRDGAEA